MVGNPEDRSYCVEAQIISVRQFHFPQIWIFPSNYSKSITCRTNYISNLHIRASWACVVTIHSVTNYTSSACSNSAVPPKFIHREEFSRRSSTVGPGFNTMKPKISRYAYRQENPWRKIVQPKSRWSLLHPKVTGVLIEKTLMHIFSKIRLFEVKPCADPESYARGGPTLTTFFLLGEGGSKYHYKRTIIGQPVKRHLNGVSQAGQSLLNIECWLGRFVIFQGIRISIA